MLKDLLLIYICQHTYYTPAVSNISVLLYQSGFIDLPSKIHRFLHFLFTMLLGFLQVPKVENLAEIEIERDRERERETDRQTDKLREREKGVIRSHRDYKPLAIKQIFVSPPPPHF